MKNEANNNYFPLMQMSHVTDTTNEHKKSVGAGKLVLDKFKEMMTMVHNDVIAESYDELPVIGIENPASNLGSNGPIYTTLPLSPQIGNVLDTKKSYINVRFPIRFRLEFEPLDIRKVTSITWNALYIYLKSSAHLFNQVQLMIGNNPFYTTVFNRQEANVVLDSLPEDYVNQNPSFTTTNNLITGCNICGWRISSINSDTEDKTTIDCTEGSAQVYADVNLDVTVDLEVLSVILSNVPYISPEFGPLKIRLYLNNLQEAFNFTIIPAELLSTETDHPLQVCESLPLGSIRKVNIASGTSAESGATMFDDYNIVVHLDNWGTGVPSTFDDASDTIIQICQSCCNINESSREALRQMIASNNNKLIIPTSILTTQLSSQQMSKASNLAPIQQQLIWQVSASNISKLFFQFPVTAINPTYLPHPRLQNITLTLNGKSLIPVPYPIVDARAVKHIIQTFLDDDAHSASEDLIASLKLLPIGNNATNYEPEIFNKVYSNLLEQRVSQLYNFIKRPNTFVFAQNLTPPASFQKGYMVASRAHGTAQLRLVCTIAEDWNPGNVLPYAAGAIGNEKYNNHPQLAVCTALLEGALVLNYNLSTMNCQSAAIEFATI